MPDPVPPLLSEAELARLSRLVMKRQAGLSLKIAAVFLAMLFGLPLVNRFAPGIASANVFGFPASWLFLGVLFYPITVILSVIFVRASDRIEDECKTWLTPAEGEAGR